MSRLGSVNARLGPGGYNAKAPVRAMPNRRIVLATLGLAAAAVAAVLALQLGDDGDGWLTYRNDEFGYEFRYPPDWRIEIRPPLHDVETNVDVQGVNVWKGNDAEPTARVLVVVNFYGGWCETGRVQQQRNVEVSGVTGREWTCYLEPFPCQPMPGCWTTPYAIVRYFDNAKGQDNHIALGAVNVQAGEDTSAEADTVRKIVESFRFVD